jgi:hypothetical protein
MTSKTSTTAEQSPDPFDPAALRISSADIPTEKVMTAVPVRRPRKDEFFRVHPGEDFTMDVLVVDRDDDQETYVVMPAYADPLLEVARPARLFTCMSRRGTVFIWPARIPGESGPGRRWAETGLKIAAQAETLWVRMYGDRGLGGYEMVRARGDLGDPKWPDKSFRELLRLAFEDRIIDRADHPVIRELHGDL